jgi:hypothetical protein
MVLPVAFTFEWDAVCREQCNVLVEASSTVADEIVRALRPHLRNPTEEYRSHFALAVPQVRDGSLVLWDVGSMAPVQQARLLRWLEECPDGVNVQVASTSSEPLYPLVEAGAFDASLYYRLNTVRIDLFDSTDGISDPLRAWSIR